MTDEFLEAKYHEGYFDGGIEPYFEPIIPLTLHPASCASFFRTGPKWPITERDYYLSKLSQFLFPPIKIKYDLDWGHGNQAPQRLEELLDQIPEEVLPELHRWNWLTQNPKTEPGAPLGLRRVRRDPLDAQLPQCPRDLRRPRLLFQVLVCSATGG